MYQIGLRLYYLVAWISSGFQSKARLWIQGRKQVFDCLSSQLPSTKKLIWFHAASLGEFEQGKPLIQALRKARPEAFILLSFYSPSGYELRKHYEAADLVCYLPFDFKSHVNRFLELVQPDVAVFIKYEFWPNLLRSLHRRGIKTYLVSARFRPDQLFFKSYAKAYLKLLEVFDRIFVQDTVSQQLLLQHGYNLVEVAGDTRVDQVISIRENAVENPIVKEFAKDSFLIIAGSCWPPEEELLEEWIRKYPEGVSGRKIKVLLVPHDVGRADSNMGTLYSEIKEKGKGKRKKEKASSLKPQALSLEKPQASSLEKMVVDEMGLLSGLYQYADLAVVGGGFGSGLHNVLEPAVFGVPIVFGPKYQKFKEAVELLEKNAAFSVRNFEEFDQILSKLTADEELHLAACLSCREYVDNQAGATALIISHLLENI